MPRLRTALTMAAALLPAAAPAQSPTATIGRAATQAEIAGWNIDIAPDGAGLPPGHGSAREGERVYAAACAACHGERGQGGTVQPGPALVGGIGSLGSAHADRTVGSYWPYATTLFDYIRRAMPYNAPESLSADQLYAVCAYILFLDGILDRDAALDATTLPQIRMPNRDGFIDVHEPEARRRWR